MPGPEMDIAKNIKALEWLKAELLDSLAALFKNLIKGKIDVITDNIALIIINCFLLAKRLGINYGQVDQKIYEKTADMIEDGHLLEDWYNDMSSLKTYLDIKR